MPDRLILISGGIILSLGFLKAAATGEKLSTVIEGGLVAIILLSLVDSFGDEWSKFASSMAVLTMVAVIYNDLPVVVQLVQPQHQPGTLQEKAGTFPKTAIPQ